MGELYNPFPKLTKNIRQIGDADQVVRLYVEDYVNTYLKRLYPAGNQTLRVGLLLGNTENYDGTPYIFIDGAIEMEDVEVSGEKIKFSENAWKRAYRCIEEAFPKRTVQGWFICGAPSRQLSPLNYWKLHNQYFNGKNKLMYLNHGLEGEEAVYVTSEDGFYRLKGHCIYYERNQMMQDYMVTRKDVRRVESGSHEKVIKDFRQRMTVRKEQADAGKHMSGILGTACGVLTVAVLAGGVVLVNNYHKMRRMESVLTSVVPAGAGDWSDYLDRLNQEPDFIIEERPGNVFPTEESGETGESYAAETMEAMETGTDAETADEDGQVQDSGSASEDGQQTQSQSVSVSSRETDSTTTGAASQLPNTSEAPDHGTVAASGVVEEAVPETALVDGTSAETTTQPHVGMGKESEQGSTESPKKEPVDYAAASAKGYRIYEIGDGETLYGICWKEYGNLKRLSEICELNHLDNVDHIVAGQRLVLP